jgi:hypothetical protein
MKSPDLERSCSNESSGWEKRRAYRWGAIPPTLPLDEQHGSAKQQHRRERSDDDGRRPQRRNGGKPRSSGIGAMLVQSLAVMSVVHGRRGLHACVGADDDRQHPVVECRHESGRGERAQREQQRKRQR